MRHVAAVIERQFILPELLHGDWEALTPAFDFLADADAIDHVLRAGLERRSARQFIKGYAIATYGREAVDASGSAQRPPYVPGLGSLGVSHKAILQHREIGIGYGYLDPFFLEPRQAHDDEEDVDEEARQLLAEMSPRADVAEGVGPVDSPEWLFGPDQSTWHLPLSVEPRKRLHAALPENWPRGWRLAPRAYIHLYPYGLLSCIVSCGLSAVEDRPISEVVAALQALTGRRQRRSGQCALWFRGCDPQPVAEFLAEMATQVSQGVIGAPAGAPIAHAPSVALSLSSESPVRELELVGLLTLDERYESLAPERFAQTSVFGKFAEDSATGNAQNLVIQTSPSGFPPRGRRWFTWTLLLIMELARAQKTILPILMRSIETELATAIPSRSRIERCAAIIEHLTRYHSGLAAHHRRWLYECRRLLKYGQTRQ